MQLGNICVFIYRWSEDFRFRVQDGSESTPQIYLKVRDGSGSGLSLGGSTFGRAVLNASVITHELETMRIQQMFSGVHQSHG